MMNSRQVLPLSHATLQSVRTNRHGQHEIVFLPPNTPPRDGVPPLAEPFTFLGRRLGHCQQFIKACCELSKLAPCQVEIQGKRQTNGFVNYSVRPIPTSDPITP